jgi:hypothetical protein
MDSPEMFGSAFADQLYKPISAQLRNSSIEYGDWNY